jgi:membrane protease YdiL (CAAX protease family)
VQKNKWLLLASPVLIVGFLRLIAMVLYPIKSNWVWVPFVLLYWLIIFILIKIYTPHLTIREVLNKPAGSWGWALVALVVGISGISFCLNNLEYYRIPEYVTAGIILALINPFFEETYWRKLMLDNFSNKPVMVIYNSVIFGLLHLFSFSIISTPNQEFLIFPITAVLGLIYSLVYLKTGSLRYVIISHFIMDIFGFSALFIR